MIDMEFLKQWILPPLIGGIIGYFTNWLAIKMLFRPYREKRIAGLRVPFTPGILPRERDRLAESLGDTVAGELLTPEVIKARLTSPAIRERLSHALSKELNKVLAMDAGTLLSPSPEHAADNTGEEHDTASEMSAISSMFRGILLSHEFSQTLERFFDAVLDRLRQQPLGSIISKEAFINAIARLAEQKESDDQHASKLVQARLARAAWELVPDSVVRALSDALVPILYRHAFPEFMAYLRTPEMRANLEREALRFVRKTLDRLGFFQRLFISLAGYDRQIEQNMPGIIDDLLEAIGKLGSDEGIPGRLSEALCAGLAGLRSAEPVALHAYSAGQETKPDTLQQAMQVMAEALHDARDELTRRAEYVYGMLEHMRLGDVLASMADPSRLAAGSIRIAESLSRGASSSSNFLLVMKEALREAVQGRTIGQVLGVEEEQVNRLADAATLAILNAIAERMPDIVRSLDVASMVAERIESLDMRELERIVLSVVKRELAWITWLGGLLGFMIGGIQSLITLL
ncbi:MAG: DUF445 family protein [Rectinemataceae bacterium]|nr:DUF445 family protein [Spirochaetaceae bacterium]